MNSKLRSIASVEIDRLSATANFLAGSAAVLSKLISLLKQEKDKNNTSSDIEDNLLKELDQYAEIFNTQMQSITKEYDVITEENNKVIASHGSK